MKRSLFTLIVFLLLTNISNLLATHLQGADIWYEHLGGGNYRIWLALYRDCVGMALPSTQIIYVESSCFSRQSFTAHRVGSGGTEVSPLCPASLPNSSCNGGSLPGTERHLYYVDVTLPCAATDWKFFWHDCCRNNAIDNLTTKDDMYVEATLNNTIGDNNSPIFNNLPVPYICNGQLFNYNHGSTDADGDVLVYSLVPALDWPGPTAYSYNSPYSATYPVITSPPNTFNFDNSTGQMNFTPNGAQTCVVVVKVEEYRGGQLIGTTMRDMQVVVINCSASPNQPVASITNLSGGTVSGTNISVCTPGATVSFDFPASDADGDNINMVSNDVATNIPGASWTVTGNNTTNPVGHFSWTPTASDAGVHQFTVIVTDDGCDLTQNNTYTITINVGNIVDAGPDKTYCVASGTPVQLNAVGGSSWTWTPATGLSCTNCQNPQASPSTTTTYTVTNNCGATDQVTVYVNNPTMTLTPHPSANVCVGQSQTLTANVSNCPSCNSSSITWSPSLDLSCTNCYTTTVTPTAPRKYYATLDAGGCILKDSVQVYIVSPMTATATATQTEFCSPTGGTTTLDVTYTGGAGTCGAYTGACLGSTTTTTIGTGTSSTGSPTPYEGFWHDGRLQMLIRASELTAAGFSAGDVIRSVAFNVATKGSSQPYNNFTIKMGCTSLTSFSSTSFVTTGLTTVFTPKSVTTTTGWNTHTLDTPYQWDGSSNLIIEVCFDNTSYTSDDDVYYTTTSFTSVVYAERDGSSGCSMSAEHTSSNRPNIRLIKQKAATSSTPPSYTWTPATGLSCTNCQSPTASPTTTTTYTVSANNGYCTATDTVRVDVGPPANATWTGAVSRDWTNNNNWNPCRPGCNTDVLIPASAARQPRIFGGNTGYTHRITIEPGMQVQIDNGARLEVCGNFIGQAGWTGITGTGANRTVAFVGTTTQTFTDNSGTIFPNVEINNGTFLDLNTDLTIDNSHSLNFVGNKGIIRTGANEVYVQNNSPTAITGYGATGYIQGNLRRAVIGTQSYDFPVGNSTFGYNLANITFTSDPTFTNIRGYFTNATVSGVAAPTTECSADFTCTWGSSFGKWVMDPNSTGSSEYTITLYPSITSPCASASKTVIKRPTGSSGSWQLQGTVCSGSATQYTRAGLTTFSEFAPVDATTPMPISELQLKAEKHNKSGLILWNTSREINIKEFVVEKSTDNNNFYEIGRQTAKGTEWQGANYKLIDNNLFPGTNYYRLRIIENDGKEYYSYVVEINNIVSDATIISNPYPNPTNNSIFVDIISTQDADISWKLYNTIGQAVLSGTQKAEADKKIKLTIETNNIADGIYLLEVKVGNTRKIANVRVIK